MLPRNYGMSEPSLTLRCRKYENDKRLAEVMFGLVESIYESVGILLN